MTEETSKAGAVGRTGAIGRAGAGVSLEYREWNPTHL